MRSDELRRKGVKTGQHGIEQDCGYDDDNDDNDNDDDYDDDNDDDDYDDDDNRRNMTAFHHSKG